MISAITKLGFSHTGDSCCNIPVTLAVPQKGEWKAETSKIAFTRRTLFEGCYAFVFAERNVPIDKYESRRVRVEIRRVLLHHWDPIGIREEPKAQNEYDGYLSGVYGLLVRGASDKEIADHLAHIVEERMSLHPQSEATKRTVRAFRNIHIPPQ